jgi:hypothetical protein
MLLNNRPNPSCQTIRFFKQKFYHFTYSKRFPSLARQNGPPDTFPANQLDRFSEEDTYSLLSKKALSADHCVDLTGP